MDKFKVLDLFSGIGGFSLGLERTGGFKTVAFCEIEEFPRKVLNKHWPEVPIYEDVRELTAERLAADGIGIDVITGGFPCQDISVAGKQKGINAERSGLWSELARLISDIRPKYAIMENVTALISGNNGTWFGRVTGDLAEIGYDCEWHCISASELGAHHHRDRVWIIAYPSKVRFDTGRAKQSLQGVGESGETPLANPNGTGFCQQWRPLPIQTQQPSSKCGGWWCAEPNVGRVVNGIPNRVDRLAGLGNAVVPQIPELIGRAILDSEQ